LLREFCRVKSLYGLWLFGHILLSISIWFSSLWSSEAALATL